MDSLLSLVPQGMDLSLDDMEKLLRYARQNGVERVVNKGGQFQIFFKNTREEEISVGRFRVGRRLAFTYTKRADAILLSNVSGLDGRLSLKVFGRDLLPWVPVKTLILRQHANTDLVRVEAEVEAPILGRVAHEVTLPVAKVPIFRKALFGQENKIK